MSAHLHHGVKAKMCETSHFVNTVGTQFFAARAKIELACDSIRAQGQSLNTRLGIADGKVNCISEDDSAVAPSLMAEAGQWRTLIIRTNPFPAETLKEIYPRHQVVMTAKLQKPGCQVETSFLFN